MQMYYWQPSCEDSSSEQHADKNVKNDGTGQTENDVLYQDPRAQIVDHGKVLMLSADLPGVQSKDVLVNFENGVLSIEAERKSGSGKTSKLSQQFYVNEQTVDTSELQANLSEGVLTITFPKREEAKPLAIPVVAANPPEEPVDGEELRFTHDLPGVQASSVKLEFQNQSITLHAERQRGRLTSNIDKKFYVDPSKVDAESFKAYLMDGVLTITGVPKTVPKKTIVVSSGSTSSPVSVGEVASKGATDKVMEEDVVMVETVEEDKE